MCYPKHKSILSQIPSFDLFGSCQVCLKTLNELITFVRKKAEISAQIYDKLLKAITLSGQEKLLVRKITDKIA